VTSPPAVGKTIYHQALTRGRNGANAIRTALHRLADDQPGPQTTTLLVAKMALALIEIERALNELDEIGRKAKNFDKSND